MTQLGSSTAARSEHYWHIGSNGKAVTATLAALCVADGRLGWATTPLELWPTLATRLHPAHAGVLLRDLLLHRAGLPAYTAGAEFDTLPPLGTDAPARARGFAEHVLSQPPAGPQGAFAYSNAGYAIAGAMLAEACGMPYTELLRTRLLAPLGLSCHFGWPLDRGPAQPRGHWAGPHGALVAHDLADGYRLQDFLAPVGNMALPLDHYARFIQLHLRGQLGMQPVADQALAAAVPGLTLGLIQELHRPVDGVSCGWSESRLAGIPTSGHEGSAGTFHCITVIQPGRDRAVTVIANAGGDSAADAVRAVAKQLLS